MTDLANPRHDATAACPSPLGILSCFIALVLCIGAAVAYKCSAYDVAKDVVRPSATLEDRRKWSELGLEQAVLADPSALLMFGRSELWSGGQTETPSEFFQSKPTGFWIFAAGWQGTDSLFFLQTVAALGNDLRGRKVAISTSPSSFDQPDDTRSKRYAGNFSPRIATVVAFDSPISDGERMYLARRMLAYPATLHDQGLVRVALAALANDSPLARLSYLLIYPLGRIQVGATALNEARLVLDYVRENPPSPTTLDVSPQSPPWRQLVTTASSQLRSEGANDPFEAQSNLYQSGMATRDALFSARTRYYQELNNRDGAFIPGTPGYLASIQKSVERTDLEHEIAVLRELGATPFVINRPEDGVLVDYLYSGTSPRATRQLYHSFLVGDLEQLGVTYVSFGNHDEDPLFIQPASDHFSRRGWLFVDRALDLFWHGAGSAPIAAAMEEMNNWAPPLPIPAPPITATTTQRPAKEAMQRRRGVLGD